MTQKKIWSAIREVTNDCAARHEIKVVKNEQGTEINDGVQMAELFNEFYSSVGQKLAEKIERPTTDLAGDHGDLRDGSFFLAPITRNEIIMAISHLKSSKARGEDGISVELLKRYHLQLLAPLEHLINLVFSSGVYPKIFKNAVIVPIYKTGDKKEIGNYRPIAITSNIGKIIEKCIAQRLNKFLCENRILSESQFGFRDGTGTEDALFRLTDFITSNLNRGLKTVAIFLDLTRAFDTVAHQVLLDKMYSVGIRGKPLELFESYLTERTQCVKINGTVSSQRSVRLGVPQGTVLGPILFLIYINTLLKIEKT